MSTLARHTARVARIKKILFLMGAGLVVLLVVLSWLETSGTRVNLSAGDAKQQAATIATMLKPHYQGLDSKGLPFSVRGEEAVQTDKTHVALQRLEGKAMLEKGAWVTLNADSGLMDTTNKNLVLDGDVKLLYSDGTVFHTTKALVEVSEGNASGEEPVEGEGPSGTIKAERFSVENRGAVIKFQGNVKTTLFMDSK